MLISTREYYLKTYCGSSGKIFYFEEQEQEHAKTLEAFHYTVVIEGAYEEFDQAELWCWKKFGSSNGLCSDYDNYVHICPIVLAEPRARNTPSHTHEGVWCNVWLGKTNYDYGYSEFCFKNNADKIAFLEAISEIEDMTEKWSKQERNS